MKKTVHRSDTRGLADHGWLKSRHTFSFAGYHNAERQHFGVLRVLNDDIVQGGQGFGTHGHDNMEIISIPLRGSLAHKDSTGRSEIIRTGDVQIMSAGTGIRHSEFNPSPNEQVNFLQIWIFPKTRDIDPRYEQKSFDPAVFKNRLQEVVSPLEREEAVWINQDAHLFIGHLDPGTEINYDLQLETNGLYLFVLEGDVEVAGETLGRRDAIGIEDTDAVTIKAATDAQVLLIDVPMQLA
jgi:redox-sensitive bicupin YhaK (pirin superfamily)